MFSKYFTIWDEYRALHHAHFKVYTHLLALNTLGCAWIYPVIYLDFKLRQDFIAKTLCINKDEPITVCNGNCFLARQLNQAQKQQQEKPISPSSQNPLLPLFFLRV